MNTDINKALNILNNGGVIAYPTDTTYGIGCDITDGTAVKRIFKIKGRDFQKPLSIACSSLEMVENYALTDKIIIGFLNQVFPGPVTLLLPKKAIVSDDITAGSDKVGVRIPDHAKTLELIRQLGHPIITTSANISGQADPVEANEVKLDVDYILPGDCSYKQPSTIIDMESRAIVRKGTNHEHYQELINKYLPN